MSIDQPLTDRRRPISVPASRAAPLSWLDDEVILLAAGVELDIPEAHGMLTVKATGAGCAITSPAGIESPTDPATTVSSRSLAVGESLALAADRGTPWRAIMGYLPPAVITAAVSSAITAEDIPGQITTAITGADIPGQIVTELSDAGLAGTATAVTTASPSAVGAGIYEINTTSNAVDLPLVASDGSGDAFITITWKAGSNTAKVSPASGDQVGHDLADNGEFTFTSLGQSIVLRNVSSGVWSQV